MPPKSPTAWRRKRALTDDELYLGPASAKLAAIRRAQEDTDDYEADPLKPCVVLDRIGDAYTAYIDPPLLSGDHRVVVHEIKMPGGKLLASCGQGLAWGCVISRTQTSGAGQIEISESFPSLCRL